MCSSNPSKEEFKQLQITGLSLRLYAVVFLFIHGYVSRAHRDGTFSLWEPQVGRSMSSTNRVTLHMPIETFRLVRRTSTQDILLRSTCSVFRYYRCWCQIHMHRSCTVRTRTARLSGLVRAHWCGWWCVFIYKLINCEATAAVRSLECCYSTPG